jgi:cell division septal protein FtsQ
MQLKVYRKDNRRKDVRRWRRWLMRLGIAAAVGACALAFYRLSGPMLIAAASLRDFIVENPYFSVREIRVRGGEKVNGNAIVALTGLRQGMNIWKIDPAQIESKVAHHPWVRRVLVHREFPRRITIDVEERVPRAIVALRKLYYVDSDGVIFKELDASDEVNFPMLTGLNMDQLKATDPIMRKRIRRRCVSASSWRSAPTRSRRFVLKRRIAWWFIRRATGLLCAWAGAIGTTSSRVSNDCCRCGKAMRRAWRRWT